MAQLSDLIREMGLKGDFRGITGIKREPEEEIEQRFLVAGEKADKDKARQALGRVLEKEGFRKRRAAVSDVFFSVPGGFARVRLTQKRVKGKGERGVSRVVGCELTVKAPKKGGGEEKITEAVETTLVVLPGNATALLKELAANNPVAKHVDKVRETYTGNYPGTKDKIEVAVDVFPGTGHTTFVEVEAQNKQRIFALAGRFGLYPQDKIKFKGVSITHDEKSLKKHQDLYFGERGVPRLVSLRERQIERGQRASAWQPETKKGIAFVPSARKPRRRR